MVGNVELQFTMHQRLTKLTHSHILRFSWVSRCFKTMSNSCPLVHSLKLSRGTTKPKDLPRWPHCGTQFVQLGALCKSSGRCQKNHADCSDWASLSSLWAFRALRAQKSWTSTQYHMDKSRHVKKNIWFWFTKQWTQYWDAGRFLHLELTTRMTAALVNCKQIIFQILLWNIYVAGRPSLKFTIGGWQQKEMVGLLVALPGVDKTNKTWQTWLRRLWRCGAFSACQIDASTAIFHHHARRHSPTLLLCFSKLGQLIP